MKLIKSLLVAALLTIPALAIGADALNQYQPGFRTIDGSQLNKMVDTVNGLTNNGAVTGNLVGGVSTGYVVARGETALDGSNPTPVTTGLTTIVACTTTIKLATAPGVGTSVITYGTSSGTLNLYGWKVTASGDATLIASTGTETIGWICVGT